MQAPKFVIASYSHHLFCFVFCVVEVCAVLKLDNCYVGQSSWKALGKECWSQQFHIDLDKVKVVLMILIETK